jgi:beta-galactosidase
LDGYKLVIVPALIILNETRVTNLTNFVHKGGHLVLTIRTGMKDEYNALLPFRQPGPLTNLAGVEVEDYYALDQPVSIEGNWLQGQTHLWG